MPIPSNAVVIDIGSLEDISQFRDNLPHLSNMMAEQISKILGDKIQENDELNNPG